MKYYRKCHKCGKMFMSGFRNGTVCDTCKLDGMLNPKKHKIGPNRNAHLRKECYAVMDDGSIVRAESTVELEEKLGLSKGLVKTHICRANRGIVKKQKYFYGDDET